MRAALREDRAGNDVTSRLFIPASARARAVLVAREEGVAAGVAAAAEAFRLRDPRHRVRPLVREGAALRPGQVVLEVEGTLRTLLSAERTALNVLGHLSGIATLTRRFVRAAGVGGPRILDTRKTLPGLRRMEKWAVLCGGGANHRMDLADALLIKENHLDGLKEERARARFVARVKAARRRGWVVEMECRDRAEIELALRAGADILLLDNFPLRRLPGVVSWIRGRTGRRRPLLEVSGGVTLKALPAIARAGVDRVSIGRLTHSAPSFDFGMDVTLLP